MCEEEDGELEIFFFILSSFVLVDVFEKKNLEKKGRPKPRNQEGKKERRKLVSLSALHTYKIKEARARTRKGRREYSVETETERERDFNARERESARPISLDPL